MQRAMYWVSPFGERRADMRVAHITANMIGSQQKEKVSESDYEAMVSHLMNYLTCDIEHDPNEMEVNPEALKRMKEMK